MAKKKVLIIGGGFGGIRAARTLGDNENVEVTLFDRRNYHLFQPLLYQVATASMSPADIAAPIRGVLAQYENTSVMMENITSVNPAKKTITAEDREYSYDYLIMACGAKHSYFAHPEWEKDAPGLKTLEQASEIRRRILSAYEMAEKETDPEKQKAFLTFVVVGGGPTGVELAGAMAEISRKTMTHNFRHIDPAQARILLVEAGPRIMPAFSEHLAQKAVKSLKELGVEVMAGVRVNDVQPGFVVLDKDTLPTATVLWAAGVQPSSLNKTLGAPLDRIGRVIVENDFSLKDHPEVFVVGDQACFNLPDGKSLPGLASVAMQAGVSAAQNILRDIANEPREAFHYVDKGTMATIGRRRAIAQIGKLEISGVLAWYMWLFVHIYYLIGFKNKIVVLFEWFYSYLTLNRGARLILSRQWMSMQAASKTEAPKAEAPSKAPQLHT